ncbi:hypothetical protein [Staphylococcus haemolyticus]|uniref:hypothetical protein n=1 Tax=Staphylococcus haemolyticus TaxID=1283 RepID=UPI002DB75E7D|nr:hypothetical protein [Staphylococcus haemolyticus]MEB5760239.1 hypothetical protein [Staphylococcus haemolyticus]
MDYLGIDFSKRTSVIAHYFEDKFQKEFTIQNNKNGYNQLLKYLKNLINRCVFKRYSSVLSG